MVLGPAESAAAPVTGKKSKSDVRILPPAAVKPSSPAVHGDSASSGFGRNRIWDCPSFAWTSRTKRGRFAHALKFWRRSRARRRSVCGIFFSWGGASTRPKPAVEHYSYQRPDNGSRNFAADAKSAAESFPAAIFDGSVRLIAWTLKAPSRLRAWAGCIARGTRRIFTSARSNFEKPGPNPANLRGALCGHRWRGAGACSRRRCTGSVADGRALQDPL